MTKQCFKCGLALPRTEFYRHPQMGDGLLGKCKACTKKDIAANYYAKHEQYRKYDHERNKLPHRRLASTEKCREFRARYPQKHKAHKAVQYALRIGRLVRETCSKCGAKAHAHHDDYSRPLDVLWLCPIHHTERHKELKAAGVKP